MLIITLCFSSSKRTWDNDRHYKRMVEAGVFQYAKPEVEYPEWITNYEKEVDQAIAILKK
jgi:hypothetical protein